MIRKLSSQSQAIGLFFIAYFLIVSSDFGFNHNTLSPFPLTIAQDGSRYGSCMFTANQEYNDQVKLLDAAQTHLRELNVIASAAVLVATKNPILAGAAFATLEYARFIDYSSKLASLWDIRDRAQEQCANMRADQNRSIAAQLHADSIEKNSTDSITSVGGSNVLNTVNGRRGEVTAERVL